MGAAGSKAAGTNEPQQEIGPSNESDDAVINPRKMTDWDTPPWVARAIRTFFLAMLILGIALIAFAVLRVAPGTGLGGFFQTDRAWAWIVAGLVFSLAAVSGLLLRPETGSTRVQIRFALIWSVILLAGLGTLWSLIDNSTRQTHWVGTPVFSEQEVASYLEERLPDAGVSSSPPQIKTGVMLQSVEFRSGSNVQVSGYIWMTFPEDLPPGYQKGFVLPDAVTEAYSSKEVFRTTQASGEETVGWYFAATMRRQFDYTRYPFDRPNVYIRVWEQDFSRAGIIVPDFDSYIDLEPTTLPGIEGQMVFGSWDPLFSGFSYDTSYYNADYGYRSDRPGVSVPEMYFNFVLKRDPLNPVTDQLFYAGTVALLVFGLLTLTTADPDDRGRFGISTAGILGSVSVLLFGIITKQTSLRAMLDSQTLTYLETLPIMLYIMLLLTALNAILVTSHFDIRILEYRNNLLPELVYWPVLLTGVFVVTMWVFYT